MPTTPFLDRRQFPELDLFKENWQAIPEEAQELCPRTMALIRRVPSINAAMFTFLPAGGILNEHRNPPMQGLCGITWSFAQ